MQDAEARRFATIVVAENIVLNAEVHRCVRMAVKGLTAKNAVGRKYVAMAAQSICVGFVVGLEFAFTVDAVMTALFVKLPKPLMKYKT